MTSLPVFRDDVKERWLSPLLAELSPAERNAVLELSVFDRFIPIQALCNCYPEQNYELSIVGLIDRFIVDSMRAGNPQIHPLVREYCFSQTPDKREKHHWAAELYASESGQREDSDSEDLTDYQKDCLLAAWSHFIEADEHSQAMEMVRLLRPALTTRGELDQVMLLIEQTTPANEEDKGFFAIDKARILSVWDSLDEAVNLVEPLTASANFRVAREAVLVLATILLENERPKEAMDLLNGNWFRFSGPTPPIVKTRFLSRFVEASLALGQIDKALEWASTISRGCQARDDKIGGAKALRYMADALHSMGKSDDAVEVAKLSVEILSEHKRNREAAISERQLASILADQGEKAAAEQHFRQALTTFTNIGDRNNIRICREHLRGC